MSGRLDLGAVVGLPADPPAQRQDITDTAHVESTAAPEAIERIHRAVEDPCPVLDTLRRPLSVARRASTRCAVR